MQSACLLFSLGFVRPPNFQVLRLPCYIKAVWNCRKEELRKLLLELGLSEEIIHRNLSVLASWPDIPFTRNHGCP
jgi:hypothetical protein